MKAVKALEAKDVKPRLLSCLKELRLPTMREAFVTAAEQARQESLSYEHYLLELANRECEERGQKRVERLLKESRLPLEKNLATFDLKRLPAKVLQLVRTLLTGEFVDRRENVLMFGAVGSGKTHLLCAIAQELVRQGRPAYFGRCSLLVQELLQAKQETRLPRMLKKLARYEIVVVDDVGYVQQNREEMEVLFTFLAERYERGSVLLTSNLPFSKWEQIFRDPMTTAAAIDRLVHHSVIVELNLPSYRAEQAKKGKEQRNSEAAKEP
jgi:DNA replication protein DnaC